MDKQNVLIIALALIVVVLGYAIYRTYPVTPAAPSPISPPVSKPIPPAPPPAPAPSAEEQASLSVLDIPGPSTTAEEYQKYLNTVTAAAKETNEVEIGQCTMNPLVVKITKSRVIMFKNKDTIEHTLTIGNTKYKIGSGLSKQVVIPSNLKGVQGYGCLPTAATGISGIILLP